jgi:uncharacterized membrane protein YfcA
MNSDLIIIILVSFGASMLTFFSGFGLGTILAPVFMFFFEPILAIAMTAIVHFLNNLFKLTLLFKSIDFKIALKFGLPAMIGSFAGSILLFSINTIVITKYHLGEVELQLELLKLLVAVLLIFFALLEIIPFIKLNVTDKHLPIGGILSGFFGGLTGHQGALRSLFMMKLGLKKEVFIATGVLIACMIDITRLGVYGEKLTGFNLEENFPYILSATLAAFAGAFIGNKLLKKVTMQSLQIMVAIMIIIFSFALALGII